MNPVFLIAIPLLAALLAVFLKRIDKVLLGIAAVLNVAAGIVVAALYSGPQTIIIGGFKPPFGISLLLDGYSLAGVLLLNVVFALIILMSFKHVGKYAVVMSIAMAALNGVILTNDLFNMFVFMEIAAIAAYILTTQSKGFKHTFNYLVIGTLASGLFLFGIVLLYNMFGSLNLMDIQSKMAASTVNVQSALILPLVLMFAGLSVETKLIPFGGWVRGVLKNANPLVGTTMLSAYAFAMLMLFGRLFGTVFVISDGLLIAFSVIAAITLVFAEASAFSKKNMREVLLFSSIAQSGLAVVLFLYGLVLPAVLVLVSNVASKLVLFTIAGKLANDLGTDEINEMRGVFTKYPMIGIGFTVASMSLIGMPLFFGFAAKANALIALFNVGNIWMPIVILLMAVVEGAYFIRMITKLWNPGEEGEKPTKEMLKEYSLQGCARVGITTVIIALVIIAAGVIALSNLNAPVGTDFLTFIKQSMGGM